MAKTVRIRDVPEDLHRKLEARAALAGVSLSEYLLSVVRRALDRPARVELLERLGRRAPVRLRQRPADAVRAERGR